MFALDVYENYPRNYYQNRMKSDRDIYPEYMPKICKTQILTHPGHPQIITAWHLTSLHTPSLVMIQFQIQHLET